MIHTKRFEVAGHLRILYEETEYFIGARDWHRDSIDRNADDLALLGYVAALAMEKGSGYFTGIGRVHAVSQAEHGAASVARVTAWVSMGFLVVLPTVRVEYRDPETFRNGYAGPLNLEHIADVRQAIVDMYKGTNMIATLEQIISHLTTQTPNT